MELYSILFYIEAALAASIVLLLLVRGSERDDLFFTLYIGWFSAITLLLTVVHGTGATVYPALYFGLNWLGFCLGVAVLVGGGARLRGLGILAGAGAIPVLILSQSAVQFCIGISGVALLVMGLAGFVLSGGGRTGFDVVKLQGLGAFWTTQGVVAVNQWWLFCQGFGVPEYVNVLFSGMGAVAFLWMLWLFRRPDLSAAERYVYRPRLVRYAAVGWLLAGRVK